MSRFNKQEEKQEPASDTKAEYDYLRAGMASLSPRKIHGRMYGKWELFMESIGVVKFSEAGYLEVTNPYLYTKYNRMNSAIEFRDTEDMKKMFELYPEARAEHMEKLTGWFKEIRKMIAGIAQKATVHNSLEL